MDQYCIGSDKLPGLAKLVEECSELCTIAAKLIAVGGDPKYFDGADLRERMLEEMADAIAAIRFFRDVNSFDEAALTARVVEKLMQFHEWHADQGQSWLPSTTKHVSVSCERCNAAFAWNKESAAAVCPACGCPVNGVQK